MSSANFGRYHLLAELGHGGMADVFLAVRSGPSGTGFSKLAVIKRLRENLAEDPEFIAMLIDEARIAARLNHPNVVQTHEVGQFGGHYFLSMEYLDGQPLHRIQYRAAQVLNDGQDLFPKEFSYLVIADALAGLHHAHELLDYDGTPLQIVHRDVTPHNVFVTYEGQVKVVDFGIAKASGRASAETREGVVKGKVRYMAPEQALGQKLDRRADIFAMGIMLWEAAVGRRMWKDMGDVDIVRHLVGGDIKAPSSVNPEVPAALDAICRKALAVRPQDRYETAQQFREELEQFLVDNKLLFDARRQLGPAIAALFEDKRSQLKAVIENQLAALETDPMDVKPVVIAPQESRTSATPTPSGPTTLSIDAPTTLFNGGAPRPAPDTGQDSGRVMRVGAVAALGLTLALVVGWMFVRKHPQPVETATAQVSAATEERVSVLLTVTPPFARITLDDTDVGSAYDVHVPRDTTIHHIVVSAEGFLPQEEAISFSDNVKRDFVLQPVSKSTTRPQANVTPPTRTFTPWRPAPTSPKSAPTNTTTTATTAVAPSPDPASATTPASRRRHEIDKNDPWRNKDGN